MKFFSANNLTQCIKPWYNIVKFLGLMPFRIKKDKFGKENFKLSWMIIFTLIYYSYFFYAYYWYFPDLSSENGNINRLVSFVDYVFFPILAMSFITIQVFQSKKSYDVLGKITEIDKTFKLLRITFPYNKIQKCFTIQCAVGFLYHLILFFVIYPYLSELHQSHLLIPLRIYYFWIDASTLTFLLKSRTILKVIKEHFIVINKNLMLCSENITKDRNVSSTSDTCDMKLFEVTEHKAKNIIEKDKIKKLRTLHNNLCDVCEIFNEIEEIPIILVLAYTFIIVIANGFFTFYAWHNGKFNMVGHVLQSIFVVIDCSILGLILIPMLSKTSKEVRAALNRHYLNKL